MSELTRFRDYCRQCSKIKHVQSAAERALWTQLADEIDAYLAGEPLDVDLFGNLTALPEDAALAEEGRRLASQRDDLIAQGVDPADLLVPLHPEEPTS